MLIPAENKSRELLFRELKELLLGTSQPARCSSLGTAESRAAGNQRR